MLHFERMKWSRNLYALRFPKQFCSCLNSEVVIYIAVAIALNSEISHNVFVNTILLFLRRHHFDQKNIILLHIIGPVGLVVCCIVKEPALYQHRKLLIFSLFRTFPTFQNEKFIAKSVMNTVGTGAAVCIQIVSLCFNSKTVTC